MRRLLRVRITRWQYKLLYAISAYTAARLVVWFVSMIGVSWVISEIFSFALNAAFVLYAARVFRGKYEVIAPVRPWWKMTSRAKLSKRVGVLLIVTVALLLLVGVGSLFFHLPRSVVLLDSSRSVVELVDAVVFYGGFAYMYLNSAVRLKASETPEVKPNNPNAGLTYRPPRWTDYQ
jgi:hypothetical protein